MRAVRRHRWALIGAGCCAALLLVCLAWTNTLNARELLISSRLKECTGTTGELNRCWGSNTRELLQENRIEEALGYLERESAARPDFIQTCHSLAHEIGEHAYKEFSKNNTIGLSPIMQICDYGFFHGFMTAFLYESHDYKRIGAFCSQTSSDAAGGLENFSRDACFHGIGHGSVVSHEAEDWKDPQAVVRQALYTCHESSSSEQDLEKCIGGAYNGMAYGPYHDVMDLNDPFAICRDIGDDNFPEECYANLASVVFNLPSEKTVAHALELARAYTEPQYLYRVVATFAGMAARQDASFLDTLSTCLAQTEDLRRHCIYGYVSGLVQSGIPESKQERAYSFCASSALPDAYRESCFTQAFDVLSGFWSEEKIYASCSAVPRAAQGSCNAALEARLSHKRL